MGNRLRLTRSNKRMVMLVALMLTVAAVCFYGAYSVGRASFEEDAQKTLRGLEDVVREARVRNHSCAVGLQKHQSGTLKTAELADALRLEIESLARSSNALSVRVKEKEKNVLACREDTRKLQLSSEGALVDTREVTELQLRRDKTSMQIGVAQALGESVPDMTVMLAQRAYIERQLAALSSPQATSAHCPQDGHLYKVVFDIGSTGNRVHAFKFRVHPADRSGGSGSGGDTQPRLSQLELEESLFRLNEVGLSKFDDPHKAVVSLDDLFAEAEKYVPEAHHRCTPVQFKATAGLRKTSKAFADAVLEGIRRHFSARATLWLRGAAPSRILEGGEEGPLAWMTVNYLLGNFRGGAQDGKPRAATIDLGGGSAQIVFEPPQGTLTGRSPSLLFNHTVDGQPVEAYQHSYEGLGLMAATDQLMQSVQGLCGLEPPGAAPWNVSEDLDSDDRRQQEDMQAYHARHFPCFPVGYTEPSTGVTNEGNEGGAADGSEVGKGALFDECAALFRNDVLRDWISCKETSCGVWGVYQPSLAGFSGDVFAFSFIYDILKPFFETNATVGRFSVDELSRIGRQVCDNLTVSSINDEVRAAAANNNGRPRALQPQRMCMYHAYVYTLLSSGLKIPKETVMRVEKKISGFEASWALGAALSDVV